jgi:hypothetical protein
MRRHGGADPSWGELVDARERDRLDVGVVGHGEVEVVRVVRHGGAECKCFVEDEVRLLSVLALYRWLIYTRRTWRPTQLA